MKTVKVVFDSGFKEYSFMCPYDNVKAGDWVIVMTPRDTPAVVTVVDVQNGVVNGATKSIVDILDKEEIEQYYKEVQERCKVWLNAKRLLDEKLAKFQERSVYAMLAEHDPEVNTLLKQLGM